MHEMSLAEAIWQQVETTAQREGNVRVRLVLLEIGQLAAVDVDALRFCLDVVLRGTLAAGARIDIEQVQGQGWCMPCGATVPLPERHAACPRCGSYQLQPTQGTQMRVKEIEIMTTTA